MEQIPTLYTYGNILINAEELIAQLTPFGINCVVDCRPLNNSHIAQNTPLDELIKTLKQHNTVYLPFFEHFGFFSGEVRNKKGEPVYRKVIQTDGFLKGIERIHTGIQKGFRICIIDNQAETPKSKRFSLIGKYLKDKYHILHIYPNGHYYTQEQVEQQIEERKTHRQNKNSDSQEVGRTGEELAALYLTRNGYQIIDKNWNLHRGCELDIVAMKDNTLHFIEVKTRSSDRYGAPQEAINYTKMHHIAKAISFYLNKRNFHSMNYQIDSIAIMLRTSQDYDLKHFLGLRSNHQPCDDIVTLTVRPASSST